VGGHRADHPEVPTSWWWRGSRGLSPGRSHRHRVLRQVEDRLRLNRTREPTMRENAPDSRYIRRPDWRVVVASCSQASPLRLRCRRATTLSPEGCPIAARDGDIVLQQWHPVTRRQAARARPALLVDAFTAGAIGRGRPKGARVQQALAGHPEQVAHRHGHALLPLRCFRSPELYRCSVVEVMGNGAHPAGDMTVSFCAARGPWSTLCVAALVGGGPPASRHTVPWPRRQPRQAGACRFSGRRSSVRQFCLPQPAGERRERSLPMGDCALSGWDTGGCVTGWRLRSASGNAPPIGSCAASAVTADAAATPRVTVAARSVRRTVCSAIPAARGTASTVIPDQLAIVGPGTGPR